MTACLMVASNEHGQHWRNLQLVSISTDRTHFFSRVIFIKGIHSSVLGWTSHRIQVFFISSSLFLSTDGLYCCLKISTAKKQINLLLLLRFNFRDCSINIVQFAMTATLDSDLWVSSSHTHKQFTLIVGFPLYFVWQRDETECHQRLQSENSERSHKPTNYLSAIFNRN